jgi:hypothetical protein
MKIKSLKKLKKTLEEDLEKLVLRILIMIKTINRIKNHQETKNNKKTKIR